MGIGHPFYRIVTECAVGDFASSGSRFVQLVPAGFGQLVDLRADPPERVLCRIRKSVEHAIRNRLDAVLNLVQYRPHPFGEVGIFCGHADNAINSFSPFAQFARLGQVANIGNHAQRRDTSAEEIAPEQ